MIVLKDIVIIFALSTLVNYLFTKIRIPTIIGYLLTGIIAGPHLLGIIKMPHEIDLMAEIGVVLLMFTIGLEFSLNHLLKIRRIVFIGGAVQLLFTAAVTFVVVRIYHLDIVASVFIGMITALSSTAVVLKLLQERSELTSNFGRTILGILIFQDLVMVPMILFTPVLGGSHSEGSILWPLLIKVVLVMAILYVGNRWIMPKVLHAIAMTKNQELFLMSIFLICLAVALLTSELGLSLAFGAFLAGLMISESEYSHNAFGHLIPFKDTFTSFFFVSIGMLLDLSFVADNIFMVVYSVLIVIVVKTVVGGGTAFLLGHTFRGTVIVGLALSQVGEFSFILAKLGFDYKIIHQDFYHLFLSVAVITMSVSPFLIQASRPLANLLLKLPLPEFLTKGLFPLPEIDIPQLTNHIVFIGKDSRALSLSVMARRMNLPYVSVVFDPATARKRQQKGEMVIYGDATNAPILSKAHAETADIIVLSVGNLITSMAIVEKVRELNKRAYIIVRTKQVTDIDKLYSLGANEVIPEEFETAIEIYQRVLKQKLIPQKDINTVIAKIRDDHYGIFWDKDENKDEFDFLKEMPNIDITTQEIGPDCFLVNKSLAEAKIRQVFGVTLVAILRKQHLIEHPHPDIEFQAGDIIYLLGTSEQIANFSAKLLAQQSKASNIN
ncbi:MAG: cation:proton antiporter [Bacteroidales bacterium]|nr:cation:proton antiporter [Bacteroidales bacterium]